MKFSINALVLNICMLFLTLFAGCMRSAEPIDNLKVGMDGAGRAYLGQVLSWGFSVRSIDAAEQVVLKIVPISGDGWSYEKVYKRGAFGGSGNVKDSLQIPDDVKVGNYGLVLQLFSEGKLLHQKKTEFTIKVDSSMPYASDLDVGINTKGTDLHLESEISAPEGIKSVVIEIRGEDGIKNFNFDKPPLKGAITHTFHEHIHVEEMQKGNYQVTLTIVDSKGKHARVVGSFVK